MFASGRLVWYLPIAILGTALVLFTIVGLGYDRHVFTKSQELAPDTFTSYLSTETISALKEDARLHQALLGLTESIALTSSDVGQRLGLEGMENFGTTLTDRITELRKRHNVGGRKRALVDEMNKAIGDLLGGSGLNTTSRISDVIGNLGKALIEGLATPALFLGIGAGYVNNRHRECS